jgi:mono/diheme cytochrome c family protein
MMTLREKWARNIALLTGVLVLLLALMFAILQNPARKQTVPGNAMMDTSAIPATLSDSAMQKQTVIAAGRAVFEAQDCMRCHAVADEGNRRNPLDGVGERRSAEEIRQWILAPAELKDQLSAWAFQAKQAYRELPAEDIDALVIYLQSLKTQPQPAR